MSRLRRYLTRMTLFVAAVAVLAGVLAPTLADSFMASPVLNSVIVALIVVGTVYNYRSVLGLAPELAWLDSIQHQAGRTPRPASAVPARPAAPPPEPRLLAPMARILGERQGRLSMSAQAMRSLLDGIATRLTEDREVARYLIGLLVLLGLLGTFWGLLRTIGSVGGVISELQIEQGDAAVIFGQLREGLRAPLAGMGLAFSTSLFGLSGSLVLGFLELMTGQAQGRFYNEVEDWLAGNARLTTPGLGGGEGETPLPAYVQALLENTAENLDALQRTLAQGEDQRRQAQAALIALVERLGTLSDQMRSQQTLLASMAEGQTELRPVLSRLAEAAASGRFGVDEATREHIRNLDSHMRRLLDDLPGGRDWLVAELRAEIKVLTRTIAALAEEAPH